MKKLMVFLFVLAAGVSFAADKRIAVPIEDSPSSGPGNAPVTIIEFIDFQ